MSADRIALTAALDHSAKLERDIAFLQREKRGLECEVGELSRQLQNVRHAAGMAGENVAHVSVSAEETTEEMLRDAYRVPQA